MAAKHIYRSLGARKLRDLSAADVDRWLTRLAPALSTRTLRELRSILSRAVNRAMARDLVRAKRGRPAELPQGRDGRRSKSLTPEQVDASPDQHCTRPAAPIHRRSAVYRGADRGTARAARDHVQLEPSPAALPHIEVWRSVRQGGDTKTKQVSSHPGAPRLGVSRRCGNTSPAGCTTGGRR